jgi:hypothetical protein
MKDDETEFLSQKQKKIRKQLLASLRILKKFNAMTIEKIQQLNDKKRSLLDFHLVEYEECMVKAIQARLHIHPRIKRDPLYKLFINFIRTNHALGNWDLFRKMRGLEVGIKRPYNREQAEFLNAVYGVIDELLWGGEKPCCDLEVCKIETSAQSGQSFMENAIQRARLSRIFDPENPPPQPREEPITISEIHRELVRRGRVKSGLQPFTRRLERLDPHFRHRKKRRKKRKTKN